MKIFRRNFNFILFLLVVFILFYKFIFNGLLPIPSDTIVGLYHPFRDLYAKEHPLGIPFKNFLITDPVRQIIPWKNLSVELLSRFEPPLWNPYQMAGVPLLANFQSSPFYPINTILLLKPFQLWWSIFIFLQPILAGFFLYLYLRNLNLNKWSVLLGALSFSFSGFSIAWMEWGTVVYTALWLPLILLSIDKIFYHSQSQKISNIKYQISKTYIKNQKLFIWLVIFLFSLVSSFLAGHLQTFFYLFTISGAYMLARWIQHGRNFKFLFVIFIFYILFSILTAIQWIPTFQFILLSARNVDQSPLTNPGWFIPWQHLIQFVAPDFFGNPTTLNYWGTWNYAELVGYIGIFPLIFALFALFSRHDKKTLFFGTAFFLSLIFSLPTIFAKLPYIFNIPFFSTSQPTRLLFITDFSLASLSALGFDLFLKSKEKKGMISPLVFLAVILGALWLLVLYGNNLIGTTESTNISVANRNLRLPTLLFVSSAMLIFLFNFSSKLKRKTLIQHSIIVGMIAVTVFDLLRFGFKFTPFTRKDYFFPETRAIGFLKKQKEPFRIASLDRRIFPPNFATYYRIQSVEGYDPLYLRAFAEFIAAVERGAPNIGEPLGFNRIITPQNFQSKFFDLLNVKYVFSLSDINSKKFVKVFEEGQTKVYENKNVIPRAFFVEQVREVENKQEAIREMFKNDFDPAKVATIENSKGGESFPPRRWRVGGVKVLEYSENRVVIETENDSNGFLVLTDSFYPIWRARIGGKETTIFRTDYNFRGIVVPGGRHKVEFFMSLF